MPSLSEIIGGTDITSHYLDINQQEFKIIRYGNMVYAIRYAQISSQWQAQDFVHMWVSQRKKVKTASELLDDNTSNLLGDGTGGEVYKKTDDKAYKVIFSKQYQKVDYQEFNIHIIKQKFFLKDNNIDAQYFVLGLWNIKNIDNDWPRFYMPKIKEKNPRELPSDKRFMFLNEFILTLRKLNRFGYAHPDLATYVGQESFCNMLFTEDGVRLIDIDKGFAKKDYFSFFKIKGSEDGHINVNDQWLYVYNTHPSNKNRKPYNTWTSSVSNWYAHNPNQSLSNNPKALLDMYKNDSISLPETIVNELINHTQESTDDFVTQTSSKII
ncbi:hypothetical protein [Legionella sp.]|uniref:hypothetical protein n=1 Tax=Legionella sp. TaxID=459 RepID=UPI00321FB3DB